MQEQEAQLRWARMMPLPGAPSQAGPVGSPPTTVYAFLPCVPRVILPLLSHLNSLRPWDSALIWQMLAHHAPKLRRLGWARMSKPSSVSLLATHPILPLSDPKLYPVLACSSCLRALRLKSWFCILVPRDLYPWCVDFITLTE